MISKIIIYIAMTRIRHEGLLCSESGEQAEIADLIPKPTHLGAMLPKENNSLRSIGGTRYRAGTRSDPPISLEAVYCEIDGEHGWYRGS